MTKKQIIAWVNELYYENKIYDIKGWLDVIALMCKERARGAKSYGYISSYKRLSKVAKELIKLKKILKPED